MALMLPLPVAAETEVQPCGLFSNAPDYLLPPSSPTARSRRQPFDAVRTADEAEKVAVERRQQAVLEDRYDLADRPIPNVKMSGGRKPVQGGVRVKLPQGVAAITGQKSPEEIRRGDLFRPASCRCLMSSRRPAAKYSRTTRSTKLQSRKIATCAASTWTSTCRIASHLVPPPIFLSSHPELGDVSRGRFFTIKNYYALMVGLITPVQMEGLRLLLTPFPQEEFNQTEDRKSADQSLGVTCLDCHSNFNTCGSST